MAIDALNRAEWLNEPPEWSLAGDGLSVTTGEKTDFWQGTWYGFFRDTGHLLHVPAPFDFTASVTFDGDYRELYDQAGMMLRIDDKRWIKLGIEFSDGVTNFSVVVTDGRSDWSMVSRPGLSGPQTVRLTRQKGAALAQFLAGKDDWQTMRLAPFPESGAAVVGPMACSPERAGFQVRFTAFSIRPPLGSALHG